MFTHSMQQTALPASAEEIQSVAAALTNADFVDCVEAGSTRNLAEFAARFLSYRPWWVKVLYKLQPIVMRLFFKNEHPVTNVDIVRPEQVTYRPGECLMFFEIVHGVRDQYLVLDASDRLLTTLLIFDRKVQEPRPVWQTENYATYRARTIVCYRTTAGRIFFNMIRPFHNLIMKYSMAYAAASDELTTRQEKPRIPGFISLSEGMRQK